MSDNKTQPNDQDVVAFLNGIENEKKRQDSLALLAMMQSVTGLAPQMWGDSIVGFGRYHYYYASGRQGDWFLTGFSPRKQNLTLYITSGFDQFAHLMAKLGKFKTSVSCLYIKKLEDIDLDVLEELVRESVAHMQRTNP